MSRPYSIDYIDLLRKGDPHPKKPTKLKKQR